jgi:hypothetical protein
MSRPTRRLRQAFVANRKALLWLFVTFMPVGMGTGYLGFWLFHTWALGFIVAGAYMLGLMFVWARMLMDIRDSD